MTVTKIRTDVSAVKQLLQNLPHTTSQREALFVSAGLLTHEVGSDVSYPDLDLCQRHQFSRNGIKDVIPVTFRSRPKQAH
jgi:hypothetical protein